MAATTAVTHRLGFFRPVRGFLFLSFVVPQLALWAALFRRFAAPFADC